MSAGKQRVRTAALGVVAALLGAGFVLLSGTPAYATVSAVSGSAFGYYTNVGFFGGPQEAHGPSPVATLPSAGGDVTNSDPDGDMSVYGPAVIFESHGPMTVHTVGSTGATGTVTSTASVKDIQPQEPFLAPGPTGEVASTCTTNESGSTGSTTITNGQVVIANPDSEVSGEPGEVIVNVPSNPAPGTQYEGEIANVADFFRIVFNEHLLTPDGITVNGMHMYMLGPTAIGESIIAQSKCGVTASTANGAPVANNDSYSTVGGQALTVKAPGLLANDSDPNGHPLTVRRSLAVPPPTSGGGAWAFPSDPDHGTLTTFSPDGSFVYVPDPGYVGSDSFEYMVTDPRGKSDTASVSLTVGAAADTRIAIGNASTLEGNSGSGGTAVFTITRSGNVSGTSSVSYNTTTGTAKATDFTAVPLTSVSFAAGELSKTVSVAVTGDDAPEANETFNVVLSAPTGASLSDSAAVGTIVNDDGQASISISDAVVTEGDSGSLNATFTITRSGNTTAASTVKYKTTDGTATAGSDYAAVALTAVSFSAGQTTKTVNVAVTGDTVDEVNETFTVNLSNAVGAVIADAAGTGTIVDNEGTVTPGPSTFYSVSDVWVREGVNGPATATFTVTRSGVTTGSGSVKYKTTPGTALAGSDFTAIPTNLTLSFAAGETSKTVNVTVVNDGATEADETFKLTLATPSGGAVLSDTSGTATIVNDEFAFVSVDDVRVTEGNSGSSTVTFTIRRSGNLGGPASVKYATANGTATAGSDFTALPLTVLNFDTGEAVKTVAVDITGDTVVEPDETFTLALSAPVGVAINDTSATATIVNND